MNVSILVVVFHRQFSKNQQFQAKLLVFWNFLAKCNSYYGNVYRKIIRTYSALHITSYLSTALSKILPHSKTIKNAEKLSVLGENDSRRLSNFLQTHIFWKFDHISRTYNQINSDYLICKSNNNSYHDGTSAFFRYYFRKRPTP